MNFLSPFKGSPPKKVLVVGATGATGKWVVQQLLADEKPAEVTAIARSKEKMNNLVTEMGGVSEEIVAKNLTVIEASFLDMTQQELNDLVAECDAVVCCLGHNVTISGMFGSKDKGLVVKAAQRLSEAIIATEGDGNNRKTKPKLVFMGTVAVEHPAGTDPFRSTGDRILLTVFRWLLPPHVDNEQAADFIYKLGEKLEWCIVRPGDLENTDAVTEYEIFDSPQGGLFDRKDASTRINVANFMVKLIREDDTWNKYKQQMPVVLNKKKSVEEGASSS
jgi:nucleoside-diphosphate-sugar epimerase